jgi:hypothetical protein
MGSCARLILFACLNGVYLRKQPRGPETLRANRRAAHVFWGPPPWFGCPCVPVGAMFDGQKGWTNNPVWRRGSCRPGPSQQRLLPIPGRAQLILASCGVEGLPIITYVALPSIAGAPVPQHILYLLSGSHPDGTPFLSGIPSLPTLAPSAFLSKCLPPGNIVVLRSPLCAQQWNSPSGFRSSRRTAIHRRRTMGSRAAGHRRVPGSPSRSRPATSNNTLTWPGMPSTSRPCRRYHRPWRR